MNRPASWTPRVLLSLLVVPAVGALSAASPSAPTTGMTIAVTNCKDSGPGSLRNAVARALSGDTVDMSGLACNTITLAGGAIVIPQQDLDFQGPGRDRLTIKGSDDRVFDHQGSGLLRLEKFSVASGHEAYGGCILAQGRVELRHVRVHHCRAGGSSAYGGGIYAVGNVALYDSALEFNRAAAADTPDEFDEYALGGGIYSGGRLRIERSHICDNVAEAGDWRYEPSIGGGAYAVSGVTAHRANIFDNTSSYGGGGLSVGSVGSTSITSSTIARNAGGSGAGGIAVRGGYDGTVTIRNSTFSGNIGGDSVGLDDTYPHGSALNVAVDETIIANSTFAFNRNVSGELRTCGGAVFAGDYSDSGKLRLTSTIVANNVCDDASGGIEPLDVRATNLEGSRNLIQAASFAVPGDTITADPQLLPLAANGGSTKTHAPRTTSPAVAAGANPYGLPYDQRGAGYPRVRGARADIGAYER